jgi:hypothetical protein
VRHDCLHMLGWGGASPQIGWGDRATRCHVMRPPPGGVAGDKLFGRGTTDCLGHVAMITDMMCTLAEKKPTLKVRACEQAASASPLRRRWCSG